MRLSMLLPVLLLAGCVSGFKSNAVTAQAYVLRVPAAAVAAGATATPLPAPEDTLQVLAPQAAAGLASDGIALIRSGERLDYYSAARWAAAAPELLQALVIDAVRGGGRFALVESDSGPFAAQYTLSLELRHFEAEYSDAASPPTVRVAVTATLGRRIDRSVLTTLTADSQVKADADRMQSVVAAFEQASAQVMGQLGAALQPAVRHAASP